MWGKPHIFYFNMKDNSKKIVNAIIVVMMITILVAISSLVVGSLFSNSIFTDIPVTGTTTNETLTNVTNITASSFAILSTYPTATCSIQDVYNSTGGEILSAGNYTEGTCTIILSDDSSYIGEDLNTTYTFSRPSGVNTANVNVTNLSAQFGLFVTGLVAFLGIIGIIIGIVWLLFYVRELFSKDNGLQGIAA